MPLQGRSRLGPFRLLARVGEGGFGVVYLGLDDGGRAVAVRALRPLVGLNYHVDVLRQVSGRHVAELCDADAEAGVSYVATRYVPGRPLDAVIEEDGPLGDRPLVRLARGLADGLCSLHEAGVVHGQLGPRTVLVEEDDPVIIDIGVAYASDSFIASLDEAAESSGFAAPELDRERATAASDAYSWGALVAYAARGRAPYSGSSAAASLPEPLAGLVAAALSPDPLLRPTAQQLRDRLDAAQGSLPEREPPTGLSLGLPEPRGPSEPAATGPPPANRWRRAYRLIGLELLALVAVLGAIAPVVTALGVVATILALRLADHVTQSALRRRELHGPNPWNSVRAVVALPWHTARAIMATMLYALVAGVPAALGAALVMLGAEQWRPTAVLTFGTATATGLFVAASWLGLGSRPLRRITEQALRAVLPSRISAILAAVALAGGIAGLASIVLTEPQDWWPLRSAPTIDRLLRR
jgi:Protein kinase domain